MGIALPPQSASNIQLKKPPLIPSSVFGMALFVYTEIMLFSGLISGFIVIKASNPLWAIPSHIQLPIITTAINTGLLVLSGIFLLFSGRSAAKKEQGKAWHALFASSLLGIVFVAVQGFEWVQLLNFGLSMNSSIFGALFFLIIGFHGLHALSGALILLGFALTRKGRLTSELIVTLQVFWIFVVGIWPFLYYVIYFH